MLRTFLLFVCAISLVFCITSYSSAALIDNGDGTITQIRSDGTKLMWTKDTLLARDTALPEGNKNWNEAKLWAANLDFAGYNDWRLPRTPGTITNGITTEGELGDLYHSELGQLRNSDKFKMNEMHNNVFWTETEMDATSVFIVNFGNFKGKYKYSYQQTCSAEDNRQVWAVRDVTDSVPAAAEVTEATTDTEVAEVVTNTEVTTMNEVTETTTDDEIVADANVTTENIALSEVKEKEPVTVTGSATEAVAAKEEVAADI